MRYMQYAAGNVVHSRGVVFGLHIQRHIVFAATLRYSDRDVRFFGSDDGVSRQMRCLQSRVLDFDSRYGVGVQHGR